MPVACPPSSPQLEVFASALMHLSPVTLIVAVYDLGINHAWSGLLALAVHVTAARWCFLYIYAYASHHPVRDEARDFPSEYVPGYATHRRVRARFARLAGGHPHHRGGYTPRGGGGRQTAAPWAVPSSQGLVPIPE
jgi:hypothetical protein